MSRYDGLGRRESVENSGTAFAEIRHNIYTYNDRNELTGSVRKEGGVTSTATAPVVDAEGRLYEYDPIGNRINSSEGTDPQVTYARNAVNQYTALTGGVSASPAYDDDGNMTGYDGAAYTWNAENRLTATETADKRITFLYDYMGRRVRKQVYSGTPGSWNAVPDETRVFVYDGWNLIRETVSGAGSGETYYVWGLDLSQSTQGAGGIGGLLCAVSGGEVRRYAYDANGNVGQLVDEDGGIVARYEYDPFGNEIRADGAGAQNNPFRFSTKYFDAETGLYYYGFRYYSAKLGRWMNRDPMGERGGVNLYAFVTNDAVNLTDVLGLCNLPDVLRTAVKGAVAGWARTYLGEKAVTVVAKVAFSQAAPVIGQTFAVGMTAWEVYSFGKTACEVYANADKIKAALREIYDDHDIINKITCLSDEDCEALADQLGEVIGSFVANMKNAREGIRKVKGIFKRLRNPRQVRETIKAHGFCFVAGTPVHTPAGLRPIENIKTGDSVLSRDEKTGKTAFRRVLRTKITPDAPVMEITLENKEKKSEKFRVTAGHPFRVRNKNWVKTQDLVIGDEIFTSAGGWLRVTGSTWLSERQTVYNFEVEEFHTYFVGETGAWVHNDNECFDKSGPKGGDDLVTVYHFTDKKGYNAITSGKDVTIKANNPPGNNPTGAYFSKKGPDELKNKAAAKLRISKKKTEYVIEGQVPKSILKEKGGRHDKIIYSPNDVKITEGNWSGYKNPNF